MKERESLNHNKRAIKLFIFQESISLIKAKNVNKVSCKLQAKGKKRNPRIYEQNLIFFFYKYCIRGDLL